MRFKNFYLCFSFSPEFCPLYDFPISVCKKVFIFMAGKGRKKLDNKLIEKAEARMVCFSKRRKGLFKKAEELSILSGAKIGILTFSQAGKLYCSDAEIMNSLLCSQVDIPQEKEIEVDWESAFAEDMTADAHFYSQFDSYPEKDVEEDALNSASVEAMVEELYCSNTIADSLLRREFEISREKE
ncbi:protein MADS AFFECTING FLOWERING 5-like, partial [Dendrobium catenatum]|uniref:protein MADS AFFECTING FLOWERING 5-like n=1 Tax=Dendrobium catenatum TaxID=906689 RepID=UPI0009F6CAD7